MEVFSTNSINAANLVRGTGNPNTVVAAPQGTLFQNVNGGRHPVYAKRTTTSSSGWHTLTPTNDCIFTQHTRQTVANTAVKTTLIGGPNVGSIPIPTSELVAGTFVEFSVYGVYSSLAASSFTLHFELGPISINLPSGTLAVATDIPFTGKGIFLVRTVSPSDVFCFASALDQKLISNATPTFSGDFDIGLAVTWSSASPSNSLSVDLLNVSLVLP